ncbi:MAG: alpha/beta hydrolase [Bdellovibrionota bacterium]
MTLNTGLQYLNFAGAQLALDYQCVSSPPTHLCILVNGYQRNRLDFRAFRKKLEKIAPHVATVAFDNRGCGETQIASEDNFSIEKIAQDAIAIASIFMQKLNLCTYSVLGISMGGMIAQTIAAESHNIDNLFLVSTTCGGVGRTWSRPVANPSQLKYVNKNTDMEATKKNMSRYFADKFLKNSGLLFEMMCKNILKTSVENGEKNNDEIRKQYDISVHYNGVSSLNKITAKKTVIFSGDEDKIIPLQNATFLKEHIKNAQLIVYPQAGHLLLIEEPEQFAQDVGSFF